MYKHKGILLLVFAE